MPTLFETGVEVHVEVLQIHAQEGLLKIGELDNIPDDKDEDSLFAHSAKLLRSHNGVWTFSDWPNS